MKLMVSEINEKKNINKSRKTYVALIPLIDAQRVNITHYVYIASAHYKMTFTLLYITLHYMAVLVAACSRR